jgi:16S rRNA (uracil1498-N3)-methyltransferase
MSERFFSPHPITAGGMMLDGPEAHHLLHVMRASVGDEVTLFDDSGAEFKATVETLRRADAELRIVERREVDRELPFALVVGVALPKGDRQKWLVEKLTELGVTTLVPLITERCVAQPAAAAVDRLRRSVIEAAKQCGRNRLMKIAEPKPWSEWIEGNCGLAVESEIRNPKSEIVPRRLIAHPSGLPLSDLDLSQPSPTHLTIGPEGGLTDTEVAAAIAAGWQSVSLGPRILRVETAAIALVAAIVQ